MAYKVVRFFLSGKATHGAARSDAGRCTYCKDPQSSSRTCTTKTGRARTRKYGPWFDGYTEE